MPLVTLGSKPSGIKKGVKRLADWSLPYHHSLRRKKNRKGGMDIAWLLLKLKVSLNFAATSTGNTHAWPVVTTPPPNPAHWCLTLLVKLHYINTRVYSWNTYPAHDVFLLAVYKRCFVSFDCRVRLKTEMEKAVFQFTVSLNIGKDRVAETLPPSRGNAEGGSNKQLELPRQHPGSWQPVHALRNFGM